MKCKVRKIHILDFKEVPECRLFSLDKNYRLIIKSNPRPPKNAYFEYFKTLEYWNTIQDF